MNRFGARHASCRAHAPAFGFHPSIGVIDTAAMQDMDPWRLHGPHQPHHPLVLDSPHSGRVNPPDFGTLLDEVALRSGEDCFVDALYMPATAHGVPLLAAQWSRLYLDVNRHADDIDPELLDAPWPE